MIRFHKIQFKNFLSYGNNWTTFEYEAGLLRILASNGSGKSSLAIDVLFFVLFGKSYRKINLNQLINSVNKTELIVKLFFAVGNNEYRIERGLKPNFFHIYEIKNNVENLIPLASKVKTYQEYFEDEIIKINEKMFSQMFCKTSTKTSSFFELSKADKRSYIETLFDIEIFSDFNKMCKSDLDEINTQIKDTKTEIHHIDLLIEQEIFNLQNLRTVFKKISGNSENIETQITALNTDSEKQKVALEKISQYKKEQSIIQETLLNLKKQKSEINESLKDLGAKIKLSNFKMQMFNDTCKGCPKISEIVSGLDLDNQEKTEIDLKDSIKKIESEQHALDGKSKKILEIVNKENLIKKNLQTNFERLAELQKEIPEIKIDESNLKKYEENKIEKKALLDGLYYKQKHYEILKGFFSDSGIKSFIIKKYLPHINKLINSFLQKFQIGVLFYLDEEFNEIITSKYKENFSYFNFSDGEKKRIDLALMFAFLEFSKLKNQQSTGNLLILDEITSNLDAEGENGLYQILRDMITKESKSILVISNSGNVDPEKIDKQVSIVVEHGFSKIQIS